jgi:hypothetical protein
MPLNKSSVKPKLNNLPEQLIDAQAFACPNVKHATIGIKWRVHRHTVETINKD